MCSNSHYWQMFFKKAVLKHFAILASNSRYWQMFFKKAVLKHFAILASNSRYWQMFFKKAVLKHFAILTGKYLCWSPFLIKLQTSRPQGLKLYWKETPTKVFFPVNIARFLKTAFFIDYLRWLLLNMWKLEVMGKVSLANFCKILINRKLVPSTLLKSQKSNCFEINWPYLHDLIQHNVPLTSHLLCHINF